MIATCRVGAAVQITLDGVDRGLLAGAHVLGQLGGVRRPGVGVQLAPLPGLAVAAQLAFAKGHGGRQTAGQDGWLVFGLRAAAVIPERAVFAAQQVVGLGRVGQVGGFHQRLPGRGVRAAQLVTEGQASAFLQEGTVQGGIGGTGIQPAVER